MLSLKTIIDFWTKNGDDENLILEENRIKLIQNQKDSYLQISYINISGYGLVKMNGKIYRKAQDFFKDSELTEETLFKFTEDSSLSWDAPDQLFFTDREKYREILVSSEDILVRKLSPNDKIKFEEMTGECSEEDLDQGYVELDHTLVWGVFLKDRLVSIASAYAFGEDERLYDIGYVTHPDFRGKGHGSLCTSALTKDILSRGIIPQIRVQPHLLSSIALAKRIGFEEIGRWFYVSLKEGEDQAFDNPE
ncbi:GNAT family N-acetyltransferase [candidate division WOR-3 bacterium]|nr:GNAT family N-acetyltransferase [candidate division WOR-3 bacterium]